MIKLSYRNIQLKLIQITTPKNYELFLNLEEGE
jgi:hypothetical protein